MAVQKRTNQRESRSRKTKHRSSELKGVCFMCGYNCHVIPVPEFDNNLLCSSCRDDTNQLTRYLENLNKFPSDDDVFFDDRI